MPNVKIRQIGTRYAAGGVGLPVPKGVNKRLVRALDPGEVVEIPDDVWKQMPAENKQALEIVEEEPSRPYVFSDEVTSKFSRPRYRTKNVTKNQIASQIASREAARRTARLSDDSGTRLTAAASDGSRKK